MADEHGIAGGTDNHAQHSEPHIWHANGRLLPIPNAEHVTHCLEQRIGILLPPGVILKRQIDRQSFSSGTRHSLGWTHFRKGYLTLDPKVHVYMLNTQFNSLMAWKCWIFFKKKPKFSHPTLTDFGEGFLQIPCTLSSKTFQKGRQTVWQTGNLG